MNKTYLVVVSRNVLIVTAVYNRDKLSPILYTFSNIS